MDYKEKVIALLNSQELTKEQKEQLEEIFHELKESEGEKNEKIRKGLIKAFRTVGKFEWGGLNVQDILIWFEKQGEQNTLNADKVIEWLKPYGCVVDNIVAQFKKDFGL